MNLRAGAPALQGGAATRPDFQGQFWVAPIPKVVSHVPADGATLLKSVTNIQVTFSSPISASFETQEIVIWPGWTITLTRHNNTTAYISANFLPSTRYTFTLTRQLVGIYSDPLAQEESFSFTTGPTEPEARLVVANNVALYSAYNQPAVVIQYL